MGLSRAIQASRSGGASDGADNGDGLLVIIPAYNEEPTVAATVVEVHTSLPAATVLVVDDGSTDATARVASACGALVLRLPYNLGVGGALRAGFRFAVRERFSRAVQVDADGQHDPAWIPRLLEGLAEADVVVGARFAGVGDYRVGAPRRVAMSALSRSLSARLGTRLTDTTSGFRAFGPRALTLFAHDYPSEYLGDTAEALLLAAQRGLRVAEVPVAMRPRQGGVPSHRHLSSTVYLGRLMFALAVGRFRPGHETAGAAR